MKTSTLKKVALIVLFGFLCLNTDAQDKEHNFGVKAGINSSNFGPDEDPYEYKSAIGFFVGGFYKMQLKKGLYLRPEVKFIVQGNSITIKDIPLGPGNNNAFGQPYDFSFTLYDYIVSIPLTTQIYVTEGLYFSAGPQFNFIIDQTIKTDEQLLNGTGTDYTYEDGETFDFGVNLSAGYDVTDHISVQGGAFVSLSERANGTKPVILNFGIDYNF